MASSPDNAITRNALSRLRSDLCGRYRLERLIGIGGMAAVYAGIHRNGHAVAIKILHEAHASDPDIERLFRREAQLANKIGHPGVVPVIDDDITADGRIFLVMPLLRGETLRARAERMGGKLALQELIVIAHAVLETLAAAHAQKIVHRDIKPENVFVTTEGQVKVLDFGIGRFFESGEASAAATKTGKTFGTPAFMAPEQALGRIREVDGRTDIWAVGAMMYTLLSGRHVHEAESPTEVAVLAATQPAPPLERAVPESTTGLRTLVDRALSFKREARWQEAADMARALLEETEATFHCSLESLPRLHLADEDQQHAFDLIPTEAPAAAALMVGATGSISSEATDVDRGAITRTTGIPTPILASGSPSRSRASRFLIRTIPLAMLTVIVGGFALLRRHVVSAPTPDQTPSASVSTSHSPLYSDALRDWHDAAFDEMKIALDSAARESPPFPVGPLYVVLLNFFDGGADDVGRRLEDAREHRANLSSRDDELLETLLPLLSVPPDLQESYRRISLIHEKTPADPIVSYAFALIAIKAGRLDAATAALASISSSDPSNAAAIYGKALVAIFTEQPEQAITLLNSCLAVSPGATSCLTVLARLQSKEGHCDVVESLARRTISLRPTALGPRYMLLKALVSENSSRQAIATALTNTVTVGNANDLSQAQNKAALSVLQGDLSSAWTFADTWKQIISNTIDEPTHAALMHFQTDLALEQGDSKKADELARDYLESRPGWTTGRDLDNSILPYRVRYLAGAISEEDYAQSRRTWLSHQRQNDDLDINNLNWILSYAQAVVTREDAREALRVLPQYSPIVDVLTRDPNCDLAIGRAYLLEDQPRAAVPYLSRAAHSCEVLDAPFATTSADLHLGRALEQLGMTRAACDAYNVVVERWGKDNLSRTAKEARIHIRNLNCSSPPSASLP